MEPYNSGEIEMLTEVESDGEEGVEPRMHAFILKTETFLVKQFTTFILIFNSLPYY